MYAGSVLFINLETEAANLHFFLTKHVETTIWISLMYQNYPGKDHNFYRTFEA